MVSSTCFDNQYFDFFQTFPLLLSLGVDAKFTGTKQMKKREWADPDEIDIFADMMALNEALRQERECFRTCETNHLYYCIIPCIFAGGIACPCIYLGATPCKNICTERYGQVSTSLVDT